MSERLKRLQKRLLEVGSFIVILTLTGLLLAPSLTRELVEVIPFLLRLPIVGILGWVIYRRYRHLWSNREQAKIMANDNDAEVLFDPMEMIRKRRASEGQGVLEEAVALEAEGKSRQPSKAILSDSDVQLADWMEDKGGDGDADFWLMLRENQNKKDES